VVVSIFRTRLELQRGTIDETVRAASVKYNVPGSGVHATCWAALDIYVLPRLCLLASFLKNPRFVEEDKIVLASPAQVDVLAKKKRPLCGYRRLLGNVATSIYPCEAESQIPEDFPKGVCATVELNFPGPVVDWKTNFVASQVIRFIKYFFLNFKHITPAVNLHMRSLMTYT